MLSFRANPTPIHGARFFWPRTPQPTPVVHRSSCVSVQVRPTNPLRKRPGWHRSHPRNLVFQPRRKQPSCLCPKTRLQKQAYRYVKPTAPCRLHPIPAIEPFSSEANRLRPWTEIPEPSYPITTLARFRPQPARLNARRITRSSRMCNRAGKEDGSGVERYLLP